MSKGNTFENAFLKLVYNATAIATLADNAASTPIANIKVALHTADPGEAGSQTTNQATYTGYAQVNVARTTGGWTVTGNSVSPVAPITFGQCTAGAPQTLTHFSTGDGTTIYHSGPIGTKQGAFTALASNDTITIPGITGVSVGDNISFYAVDGQSLPTGITEGTLYFVKTVSGTAITISATSGGTTLDITADGEGYAFKNTPFVVTSAPLYTPALSTSTTITED